jgi:hypothetical protein
MSVFPARNAAPSHGTGPRACGEAVVFGDAEPSYSKSRTRVCWMPITPASRQACASLSM